MGTPQPSNIIVGIDDEHKLPALHIMWPEGGSTVILLPRDSAIELAGCLYSVVRTMDTLGD